MAARFAGNPEIAASLLPLAPMRLNAPTACAAMREEVRQFVEKGAIDFVRAVFREAPV
jgi:hypothetical protein